jgi:phage shock protein A
MNTINKLLARWGYKLRQVDAIDKETDFRIGSLQRQLDEMEAQLCDYSENKVALQAEIKELKRKLACKTAGEWYWRKQAREARGQ